MEKHGPLSDAQYQERVRQLQRRRERQQEDDLRDLMRAPWGRRFVYWFVFERGNLHGSVFDGGIKDGVSASQHMALAEGRRELAGELLERVKEHAAAQYLEMMAEQVAQRQADLSIQHREEEPQQEIEQ